MMEIPAIIKCACCCAVYDGIDGGDWGAFCEVLNDTLNIDLFDSGKWWILLNTGDCKQCGCRFELALGNGGWEILTQDHLCAEAKKRGFPKKLGKWSGKKSII